MLTMPPAPQGRALRHAGGAQCEPGSRQPGPPALHAWTGPPDRRLHSVLVDALHPPTGPPPPAAPRLPGTQAGPLRLSGWSLWSGGGGRRGAPAQGLRRHQRNGPGPVAQAAECGEKRGTRRIHKEGEGAAGAEEPVGQESQGSAPDSTPALVWRDQEEGGDSQSQSPGARATQRGLRGGPAQGAREPCRGQGTRGTQGKGGRNPLLLPWPRLQPLTSAPHWPTLQHWQGPWEVRSPPSALPAHRRAEVGLRTNSSGLTPPVPRPGSPSGSPSSAWPWTCRPWTATSSCSRSSLGSSTWPPS